MLDQNLQFAIISAAIDAGISYQDEFSRYCKPAWMATFPAADAQLAGYSTALAVAPGPNYTQACDGLIAALKQAPRGTWASLSVCRAGVAVWPVGFMSNGAGEVHTEHRGASTYELLLDAMVAMEIFVARRAHEQHRKECEALACIKSNRLQLNYTFRNVRIGGYTFSTAVIVGISKSGMVELICTRRGSAKRYNAKVLAQRIEQLSDPRLAGAEAGVTTAALF